MEIPGPQFRFIRPFSPFLGHFFGYPPRWDLPIATPKTFPGLFARVQNFRFYLYFFYTLYLKKNQKFQNSGICCAMTIEKKDKMTILNFCVIVRKKDPKIRFIKTNFFILDRNVINLRNRNQSIWNTHKPDQRKNINIKESSLYANIRILCRNKWRKDCPTTRLLNIIMWWINWTSKIIE